MPPAVALARAGTGRTVTRALLPQPVARLVGFAALASVGALEWQRLVGGLSSGRALLWVAVAVVAAAAVLASERVRVGWPRAMALGAVSAVALLVGYWLSGAGLELLRFRNWDDLVSGLAGGLQALGTVRLPYVSADPWPRIVLELLGAELLIGAGLLTFWPRSAPDADTRVPLAGPDRGYPFLALAVLLIVIASPVVSLGGTRSLMLGLTLAALTVCFLWLERLPLKPGLGVTALLAVALAGALPLAAVADRGEAWFDYRSFAESLGPDDPVRFSWAQSYGPITWPRDGNEVLRISSTEPRYWKARNLDVFDGRAWVARRDATPRLRGDDPWSADLPEDWQTRANWTSTISVSVRRMRTPDVIGAGTIVGVRDASRGVRPGLSSGTWDAPSGLRRGDSYTAEVHSPQPSAAQLGQATSGIRNAQEDDRIITVPFRPGRRAPLGVGSGDGRTPVYQADVHFVGWDGAGISRAEYPSVNRSEFDIDAVMARSLYARTWTLSKRLKRGTEAPMDYVRAVDSYLHGSEFRYTERPPQPPPNRTALDSFINDSHQGYCQHFAGAMALLLRMGGIPARVVTGFSPGGYSERRKAWVVRDNDAHAWVEAWFDRFGWVTFDPTPDATPARSQIAALTAVTPDAPLAPDRADAAEDTGAADSPIRVRPDLLLETNDPKRGQDAAQDGTPWWVWAGGTLLVLTLLVSVLLFVRRPRGNTPMDRSIAELEDALRRVGRPISTGTTLTQLERRLGSHSPEVAAYLRALADGRYAAAPEPPPRTGRRALRRALAQGLGFGGSLRALWALPPRPKRPRRPSHPDTFEVDTIVRG